MALRSARGLQRLAREQPRRGPAFFPPPLSRQQGLRCSAFRMAATVANVRFPTKEDAASLPVAMCELSNETLIILAEQGCHDACAERLARNIMHVDGVEWAEAKEKLREVQSVNRQVVWLVTLPYKAGISVAFVTGVGCIPMVFSAPVVEWFNLHFVTTDVPEAKDLQTVWEVGSWAWNWMEPPLGTASFTLLAFQFIRSQMLNMNLTPYTSWVQDFRAKRLSRLYPQYNEDVIKDYARTASLKPMKLR